MSFFEELKRRNVVRMAILYGVGSWLILQISDVLFDQLGVPGWAFRLVLGLLVLGFPIALVFSWVFELTPEGLKREREIDRTQSITQQTGRKINNLIVALLVLAIVGLIADRLVPEKSAPVTADTAPAAAGASSEPGAAAPTTEPVATGNELSIAVLPFVNMSGDAENEYFSDGLSEELLNTLVQIPELKVTGRTSSFAFKGQNLDLREVGERLNVANVLEGSVRKAANRVRITAQLIKTADGYHLWSETFDRDLDDIFAIQAEIAQKVAQALSLTLLGGGTKADGETRNAEAYQAYLRGAHVFRRAPDDKDNLQIARKHFEQAIALDPDYIAPRYGMFQYWDRMNRIGEGAFADTLAQMKQQADLLTQLAPDSVEALMAEAVHSLRTWDWQRSLDLSRGAWERFPGSVETTMLYGNQLNLLTDSPQGMELLQAAVKLDPLSLQALVILNGSNIGRGNCGEVQSTTERALEIEPGFSRVRSQVGYCLLMHGGDPEEALSWISREPVGFLRFTGAAIALQRLGRKTEAEEQLKLLQEDSGDSAAYQYAQIHAQWGETAEALEWLQTAIDTHDPGALAMGVDNFLDPIRQEQRFAELMHQIGLDSCCRLNE